MYNVHCAERSEKRRPGSGTPPDVAAHRSNDFVNTP